VPLRDANRAAGEVRIGELDVLRKRFGFSWRSQSQTSRPLPPGVAISPERPR
jgi:hypothetical protein